MNIEQLINEFKNCDLSEIAHHKIIRTIINNNIQIPIIVATVKEGTIIERGRISDEGKIYNSEFKISYNTAIGKILKYGRANKPFQSMFYGAMISKKITPVRTLFAELVEQFRKIPNNDFTTTMTVGRWIVTKEFEIADVCFSKIILVQIKTRKNTNYLRSFQSKLEIYYYFLLMYSRKKILSITLIIKLVLYTLTLY